MKVVVMTHLKNPFLVILRRIQLLQVSFLKFDVFRGLMSTLKNFSDCGFTEWTKSQDCSATCSDESGEMKFSRQPDHPGTSFLNY